MTFTVRLFLGVLALVVIALGISFNNVRDELVPGMRQSLEEVLVDTAHVLAAVVEGELSEADLSDGRFAAAIRRYGDRELSARIFDTVKTEPGLTVYITDADGRVVFDSRGRDVGADYSQWNDVYNTLRGRYGARATEESLGDGTDAVGTVMYVAAPLRDGDGIVGVLTVGKPAIVVMPFVEAVRRSLWNKSLVLLAVSLVVAGVLTMGLTQSIRRLTRYADAVTAGKRVDPPDIGDRELGRLSQAMATMRSELEGKNYVEGYLYSLTHELKGPLTAIEGAAELMEEEDVPEETRRRFVGNIRRESRRLSDAVDRLLRLSALEGRTSLETVEPIDLASFLEERVTDWKERSPQPLTLSLEPRGDSVVHGDAFLLRLAVDNLIDNAIDFSPEGRPVELDARIEDRTWSLEVVDHGPGIPEFAAERVFDRFFSLPRPEDGPRSTGLGLSAVREIASLHGGDATLTNHPAGGAVARLTLRRHPDTTAEA